MKTLLGILITLTCLAGVHLAQKLIQSDSGVVKPGSSHTMTCKGDGTTLSSYWMSWVRQQPNKGLQWLCRIYSGTTHYADAVKGRVTISSDNSNNMVSLQINNMNAEDTAVYYCARNFDKWGPGTFVTVTSATSKGPSLFPLIPCGQSTGSAVTVGCLAKNFLPNSIEFSYQDKSNNSFSTGLKQYNSVLHEGTYLANSQITVPTSSWDNHDVYYCNAKHPAGNGKIPIQNPLPPQALVNKPTVTMHPPIKEDLQQYNNGTIVCRMSEFRPGNIEVKWMKSGTPTVENVVTEDVIPDGNGNFMRSSYITVSKSDWDADKIYSCVVRHAESEFFEIRNLSKSAVCDVTAAPSGIVVSTIPPSFETLYMEKKAPLTCLISNMNNKDGLNVVWYDGEKALTTKLDDLIFNDNQTYSIKAIATVCPEDWNSGRIFECTVEHPDLAIPQKVKLSKQNGKQSVPTVFVFPPHQDELAKKEGCTVSCLVKSFYPPDLFVKWLDSDNKELTNVVTTGPIKEGNLNEKETYFTYSILSLPNTEEWNSGRAFTCMVGHESLPLQAIQRSIDKTAGKPTSVNVSLVMSDTCS